jgi:hypothetical protein
LEQESADLGSLALREYFLRQLWGMFVCFAQLDYSRRHSVLLMEVRMFDMVLRGENASCRRRRISARTSATSLPAWLSLPRPAISRAFAPSRLIPVSSSSKAIGRYRDLCIVALEVRI